MGIKIEVEGYEADKALDRAMELAVQQAVEMQREKLAEAVEDEIRGAVDAKLGAITEEMVRSEVARVLAEGWRKTNSYGEPFGQLQTLKGLILEKITGRSDSYSNSPTMIEKLAQEQIREALQKEFGKELEAAREKLRALVDGTISEKMRDLLKGLFR